MAEILKPDMSNIWASGGAKIAPTSEKVQLGWTAEIPPHQWENWAQNRQDQGLVYIFQHGVPEWDAGTEYFLNKSIVQVNGVLYRAIANNIGVEPSTNPLTWTSLTDAASQSAAGIVKLATTSQAQAQTDDSVVITPKKLADAFGGVNQSLSGLNGFQKLPGGMLLQFGQAVQTTPAPGSVTFPRAFPNAVRCVVATALNSDTTGEGVEIMDPPQLTGFQFAHLSNSQQSPGKISWLAIGF